MIQHRAGLQSGSANRHLNQRSLRHEDCATPVSVGESLELTLIGTKVINDAAGTSPVELGIWGIPRDMNRNRVWCSAPCYVR